MYNRLSKLSGKMTCFGGNEIRTKASLKLKEEWLITQVEVNKLKEETMKNLIEANETLENIRRVKRFMTDVRFKLYSSKEALIFSREQMELREFTVIMIIKESLLSLVRNVSFYLRPQNEDEFSYGSHSGFDFTLDVTAGLSMDKFSSACKLSLGAFSLGLLAEQSCDLICGYMEYYMKHKWKSKQLQIDSVFRTNHPSNFAKIVLKPSLTDFVFDGNGFCNDRHGELLVPIKLLPRVIDILILILGHIVKAEQDLFIVKNELRDTKLLLASETFTNGYKYETWLFMHIILKSLRAGGFERETWTIKKRLEWLNELTTAINVAQRICFKYMELMLALLHPFEFISMQQHPVHSPYPPADIIKAYESIPSKKISICHYKVQWKEHPPFEQAN